MFNVLSRAIGARSANSSRSAHCSHDADLWGVVLNCDILGVGDDPPQGWSHYDDPGTGRYGRQYRPRHSDI